MAVTYNPPVQIDPTLFRLSWSSNAATPVTFRVYREGVLVTTFASSNGTGSWDFTIPPGDEPFIEVLDNSCDLPTLAYPGRITLNWRGSGEYDIEEFVADEWISRGSTSGETGIYLWGTRWLEDVTTHTFRVIPDEGDNMEFAAEMVRHPDSPTVAYSFDSSSTTLTISEA